MDSGYDSHYDGRVMRGYGRAGFVRKCVTGASVLALLLSCDLWAALDITANGLFKDKAMLTIDGKARLLKAGETSPEGVELVSSHSKQAIIKVGGKNLTLRVSQRISSSFKAAKITTVSLVRRASGHFYAKGAINGYPTNFLVDTGATAIAMSLRDARRLKINVGKSPEAMASTAGGIVNTYKVNLHKVSVGPITVHNVPATVVDGDYPEQILLGNTFLSQVEMQEESGVLVLKKKF